MMDMVALLQVFLSTSVFMSVIPSMPRVRLPQADTLGPLATAVLRDLSHSAQRITRTERAT